MSDGIWIQASEDPETGAPVCVMTWDGLDKVISPDDVRVTARDLMAAAAHAESDKALVEELTDSDGLGLDVQTAGMMLKRVRERRTRARSAGRPALRIEAVYGANTRAAMVHVGLGSRKAALEPDEARQMAQNWTEAAVAAQVDARTRYVLRTEYDFDDDRLNRYFDQLQEIQLRHDGHR